MGRPPTPLGQYGTVSFRRTSDKPDSDYVARAYFRDPDGVNRPVTARGRTKPIAENALREKLASRATERFGGRITSRTSISEVVEIYAEKLAEDQLSDNPHLATQTVARYLQTARGSISTAFRGVAISEVTAGQIERFLTKHVRLGHVSEARNCRVVLRSMMRLAVSDGAIGRNPFSDADIRLPVSSKTARALTAGELVELRRLVSTYRTGPNIHGPRPSSDLMDLLNVMLGIGTRISETLALRTVDLSPGRESALRVSVSGTIITKPGVGAIRQNRTKSGRTRTFDVADWISDILLRRSAQSSSGLLWETKTGRPILQQNLMRNLRAILDGSDLAWVTSHALRKTAGTEIAMKSGVALATEVLGHSSDQITRSIYIDSDRIVSDMRTATSGLAPA